MKTQLAAAAAALLLCSLSATTSHASVQMNDLVKITRPAGYYGTSGGEFLAEVDDNDSNPNDGDESFRTFCVQTGEYISLGGTYRVLSVGSVTVAGNVPLGSFAAWLYTKYLAGGIAIVNDQDANAVQVGIWRSMGYLLGGDNTSPVGSNYDASLLGSLLSPASGTLTYQYYNDFTWHGVAAADTKGNIGTYTGQIQIMNLVTQGANPENAQDQLVRDSTLPPPPGTSPTPEPMSVFVWSMLAMCAGSLGLRSRNV